MSDAYIHLKVKLPVESIEGKTKPELVKMLRNELPYDATIEITQIEVKEKEYYKDGEQIQNIICKTGKLFGDEHWVGLKFYLAPGVHADDYPRPLCTKCARYFGLVGKAPLYVKQLDATWKKV